MKKIVYASGIIAALSLTLFTGCKKDSEAFPTKTQSNNVSTEFSYVTPYFPTIADADGILIAVQVTDEKTVVVSPFKNLYEYGMAKFTSSTGNFTNLTDAGNITVNDSNLVKGSDLSYLSSTSTFSLNFSNQIRWNITGSSTVPAMQDTLAASANPSYSLTITSWDNKWSPIYPHLPLSDPTNYTYDTTSQFSIPVKQYATNADSIMIAMIDQSGFSYHRTVAPTDSIAKFRPIDFLGYSNYDLTTFSLQISAIKYTSKMVSSKKYYFLKMSSYIKYYAATK